VHRHKRRGAVFAIAAMIACGRPIAASPVGDENLSPELVAQMSLEELMAVHVTSVEGVERTWFTTPAAIDVITGEDIRRSGHRTLAEVLRLAPGVFVGRQTSQASSVGMRGFNGSLANKTLILIDGRTVYDPLFGGTFWNVQDVLLEDVDRIEVIRGPGPTLWGANAVNGVVNIITKSAKNTQGVFLQAGGGTYERAFGSVRYGFQVSDDSWLRVYGMWSDRDHLVNAMGGSTFDDWDMGRGGFRFDHEGADGFTFTFQGDAYHSDRIGEFTMNAPVPGESIVFVNDIRDVRNSGGNLLARLAQDDDEGGWSLQGYVDRTERVTNVQYQVHRTTLDLDWRHYFNFCESHTVMWGLGVRHSRDTTEDGYNLLTDPLDRSLDTFSAFVQDTITLEPDRLFAMVGTKFEHNDYTGFEVQPSARLWWTPNDRHTVWASVSRAVRIPSRSEAEGSIVFGYIDTGVLGGGAPTGEIIPLGVTGNSGLDPETLIAYEAGYRVRATDALTFDMAVFYNDYDQLIYVPSLISPFDNASSGETYGGEVAAEWRVADNWTVEASYSFADVQIHGTALPVDERNTPHHQAQLRSYFNLTDDIEFNSAIYYVDNVPQQGAAHYVRLDMGITWRVTPNLELAVWGQNLLDSRHREFSVNEVERGFYFMGTLRF
jgi:iron complex outermembrane receptor protein